MIQARKNRRAGAGGYQLFTPKELDYNYEPSDIICYVPSNYGRYHCDIYIGNNEVCGGNLSNTFAKNEISLKGEKSAGFVNGNRIKYVIRKTSSPLKEWKNLEVNRLLMEKFNIGNKEN